MLSLPSLTAALRCVVCTLQRPRPACHLALILLQSPSSLLAYCATPLPPRARAHLPYSPSLLTRRRSPEAITLAHQPRQQRLAKRRTRHVSLVHHLLDCAVEQLFCDQLPQAAAARRLLACQTPEDLRRQSQLLLPRTRGK